MGAKYIYNAAFARVSGSMKVEAITIYGFGWIWKRFGMPDKIMFLNYKDHWEKHLPFSMNRLLELVPPNTNELVFVYPESIGECSLEFASEGRYSIVSAAVDLQYLSDRLATRVYDQLKVSLQPYSPCVLLAGEELSIDERLIDMALGGSTYDKAFFGVDWQYVF